MFAATSTAASATLSASLSAAATKAAAATAAASIASVTYKMQRPTLLKQRQKPGYYNKYFLSIRH